MRPDFSMMAKMIASTLCETGTEFPCPYVRGRQARFSGFDNDGDLPDGLYESLMLVNFRRNGSVVYRPNCRDCSECRMLRIPTQAFKTSRRQRRCLKRNADVRLTIEPPVPTAEKHALYERYLAARHTSDLPDDDAMDGSKEEFENFLYTSCVSTSDFVFRDGTGKLLAVAVVDREPRSLSAVYCYFDPVESKSRSLGTFGVLRLIEEAARQDLDHVYLGYWVKDSRKMGYKSDFQPSQIWSPVFGFSAPGPRL